MVSCGTPALCCHLTNIVESVIDRILHPELRDRMIIMRGVSYS